MEATETPEAGQAERPAGSSAYSGGLAGLVEAWGREAERWEAEAARGHPNADRFMAYYNVYTRCAEQLSDALRKAS